MQIFYHTQNFNSWRAIIEYLWYKKFVYIYFKNWCHGISSKCQIASISNNCFLNNIFYLIFYLNNSKMNNSFAVHWTTARIYCLAIPSYIFTVFYYVNYSNFLNSFVCFESTFRLHNIKIYIEHYVTFIYVLG